MVPESARQPITKSTDEDPAQEQASLDRAKDTAPPGKERVAKALAAFLVAAPILFNLVFLYPETIIEKVALNDLIYHFTASRRMSQALTTGENPIDCWVSNYSMGYPLWRSYQPFPHLATALLLKAGGQLLPCKTVFTYLAYLMLSFLPLCFFMVARACGLGRVGGGAAAALSMTLSSFGELDRYGISFGAQVWRGSGLHTQLWSLALMLCALAFFLSAIRKGRGLPLAGVLLALAGLSHIVFGYVAFASAGLAAILGWEQRLPPLNRRLARAVLAMGVGLAVMAFFLVPLWQDRDYINHSRWESPWKWDSLGAAAISKAIFVGKFFDAGKEPLVPRFFEFGRLPVLTSLVIAGFILALVRCRKDRTSRLLLVLGLAWLLVFFGRHTWGHLLKLALIPEDMHLHRFQAAFEVFAVLLAAMALERLVRWLAPWRTTPRLVVCAALLPAILLPLYVERAKYLMENTRWGMDNLKAYNLEQDDIDSLVRRLSHLASRRPGRVHAGRAATWGKQFKVGSTPLYSILTDRGFDGTSFLYHAMSIASDTMVLLNESRLEDFELFGIRWIVAPEGAQLPQGLNPLGSYGRFRLYEVPRGGMFDVISIPYAFEGDRKTIFDPSKLWLTDPLRSTRQHVALYLGDAPDGVYKQVLRRWDPLPAPDPQDSPPPGEILAETRAGQVYAADVNAGGPCHLLFKSSFHPGLRALVDGKPVDTIMVTPGFLALPLSPGVHHVEVSYSAGLLKPVLLGLGVLAAALAGCTWGRGRLAALEQALCDVSRRIATRAATAAKFEGLMRWRRKHALFLLAILVLGLIALRPCYRGMLMDGHDATEYPARIVEYHENVSKGVLFPIWAPDLGNGFGQPLFQYVPPLFFALAQRIHSQGAGLADSIQFAALLFGFAAALGMYGLGVWLGSRKAGLVMAVAYLFSPYFQTDLYVRGNFMEFTAICIAPVALWMLLRVVSKPTVRRVIGAVLAMGALLLSHNVIALIALPALVCIALARGGGNLKGFAGSVLSVAGGMALSAFFWMPALFEKEYAKVEGLKESFLNYSLHFVSVRQLIYSPWGYGLSLPGTQDGMSFMLGPAHLVLGALGAASILTKRGYRSAMGRFVLALVVAAVAGVFMSTGASKPIWDLFPTLQYLSFPWRFHCIPSLALSILAGLWLLQDGIRIPKSGVVAASACAALLLLNITHARPSRFLGFDDEYYAPEQIAKKGLATTTLEEYEPVWVRQRPAYTGQRLVALDANAGFTLSGARIDPQRQRFLIRTQHRTRLRLNTFFFPGWEIAVDDRKAAMQIEPVYGRMIFAVPEGVHRVDARLLPTSLRRAGRWISYWTALALVGLAVREVLWRT